MNIAIIGISTKPELLLCPFCGSPAAMRKHSEYGYIVCVQCTNPACGVEIRDTKENAVKVWNTRVEKLVDQK